MSELSDDELERLKYLANENIIQQIYQALQYSMQANIDMSNDIFEYGENYELGEFLIMNDDIEQDFLNEIGFDTYQELFNASYFTEDIRIVFSGNYFDFALYEDSSNENILNYGDSYALYSVGKD